MQINKEDWNIWARKAQAGDKESYGYLLTSLLPYVRAVLYPRISQKEQIDDLVQEILMGVHKSLPRYLPDQPFSPWLHAIIRFRTASYFSNHYKERDFRETVMEQPTEEAHTLQHHERLDLEKALAQLDDKQAQIFRLLKIEGLSVRDVATRLGMSESAVKVSVHRTIKKLKVFLQA